MRFSEEISHLKKSCLFNFYSKLAVENCDLTHHAEEAERTSAQLSKDKTSLSTQLEDARRLADAETRVSDPPSKLRGCFG